MTVNNDTLLTVAARFGGRTSAAEIYAANRHRLDGLQHPQKKSGKPANFKPRDGCSCPSRAAGGRAAGPYDCAACRGRNVKHACAGVFVGDPARWRRREALRRVRLEGRRPRACALAGHGDAPAYDSQPDVGDGLRVFRGGRWARAEVASVGASCASTAASSPARRRPEEAEVVSSLAPVRDDAAGADDDGSVAGVDGSAGDDDGGAGDDDGGAATTTAAPATAAAPASRGPAHPRRRDGREEVRGLRQRAVARPHRGRRRRGAEVRRRVVRRGETRELQELTRCFDRAEGKPAAAKAPKAKATAPAPKRAAPPPPPPCDECRFCLDKPRNGGRAA
ncbi:hypothetical protein JL720_8568 [Aureococcus anophagefferens]|nr:hypothetical protein JL720_8568 [Aureococcus anophagefferens]